MSSHSGNPEQVAILAPSGRAGDVLASMLTEDGIVAETCGDLAGLLPLLDRSGLAILSEEVLQPEDLTPLVQIVEAQPDWSDYPFVLLMMKGGWSERDPDALRQLRALGNITFLERPFRTMTLVSIVRTALASRRRQYQARDRLVALEASRAESARSDEQLTFALEAGKLGAWEIDLPTMNLTTSALCRRQFAIPPGTRLTYPLLLDTLHPEDRILLTRSLDDPQYGIDYQMTCRIVTDAGATRWIEVRGRAIDESATRIAGVSLDVTERRHAEDRQQLLIRELHHRVKNTLSTVQAIVGSTARGATGIEDFYRDFTGRIQSLARTHTILTEELWQRASLHELLGKELDLYNDRDERIRVSGPDIELSSEYAVPLGMAFHELATNAAKYGALSNGIGRVSVDWVIEAADDGPNVHLDWIESGGPPVEAPKRQGFGTRLLDRVLTAQVKADVRTEYHPGGVRVSLVFALPATRVGEAPKGWV